MKNVLIVNASPRPKGNQRDAGRDVRRTPRKERLPRGADQPLPGAQKPRGALRLGRKGGHRGPLRPVLRQHLPGGRDRVPSKALAARPEALHGQRLYGIIQGGMPYMHTHESGLNMLGLFRPAVQPELHGRLRDGLGAPCWTAGRSTGSSTRKRFKRLLSVFFRPRASGRACAQTAFPLNAQPKLPVFAWRLLAMAANRDIDKRLKALGQS